MLVSETELCDGLIYCRTGRPVVGLHCSSSAGAGVPWLYRLTVKGDPLTAVSRRGWLGSAGAWRRAQTPRRRVHHQRGQVGCAHERMHNGGLAQGGDGAVQGVENQRPTHQAHAQ